MKGEAGAAAPPIGLIAGEGTLPNSCAWAGMGGGAAGVAVAAAGGHATGVGGGATGEAGGVGGSGAAVTGAENIRVNSPGPCVGVAGANGAGGVYMCCCCPASGALNCAC